MTPESLELALRWFCRRRPFRPFVIELKSRSELLISHPEAVRRETELFVSRSPDGRHSVFSPSGVARLFDPPSNAPA